MSERFFVSNRPAPRAVDAAEVAFDVDLGPSLLEDADLFLVSDFIASSERAHWLERLRKEIPFAGSTIHMFGREIPEPRLTSWHGDSNAVYTYSKSRRVPLPWTSGLTDLRGKIERTAAATFNSVLANLYRDGRDSMGFHADREPELGPNPTIASLSLGFERAIVFQHRSDKLKRLKMLLPSGSLLVMGMHVQDRYRHAIPKVREASPRLNLTFRNVTSI